MERSVRNDPFYPIQTDTAELVTAPIEAALGADGNLGGGNEPHTDDRRGILPLSYRLKRTPLDQAVRTPLVELGCMPADTGSLAPARA